VSKIEADNIDAVAGIAYNIQPGVMSGYFEVTYRIDGNLWHMTYYIHPMRGRSRDEIDRCVRRILRVLRRVPPDVARVIPPHDSRPGRNVHGDCRCPKSGECECKAATYLLPPPDGHVKKKAKVKRGKRR
jgi:hypothetical protein